MLTGDFLGHPRFARSGEVERSAVHALSIFAERGRSVEGERENRERRRGRKGARGRVNVKNAETRWPGVRIQPNR